jgi:hypothetical protein
MEMEGSAGPGATGAAMEIPGIEKWAGIEWEMGKRSQMSAEPWH